MKIEKWFLKSLFVFLCCFVLCSLSLAQENLPDVIKKTAPSIVLIFTYDSEGNPFAQGSGFFISENGNIITNRHVLEGSNRAEVKTAKGEIYPITKIVAEDKEGDIILVSVEVPLKTVHPLQVSSSIPEVGERVLVIGNPLGLEQTVSDGIVSAVRDIPAFGNIIQITAPISAGSSGSPVVNTKGEVIGVATFQMVEGQNLNFVIPSERIKNLKLEKGKNIAEWQKEEAREEFSSAEKLYYTGLAFLWARDYEKALPYFEKAVKENPNYTDGYFQIGYCKDTLGRYQEAIEAYKQAIRIKPDYAEAHFNLGVAYFKLGRYQEAVEANKQAIRIKPDYADAHNNLGLAYLMLEDKGSALDEYKILKKLDPDSANELFNLIYK